jgi:hypothetical protein
MKRKTRTKTNRRSGASRLLESAHRLVLSRSFYRGLAAGLTMSPDSRDWTRHPAFVDPTTRDQLAVGVVAFYCGGLYGLAVLAGLTLGIAAFALSGTFAELTGLLLLVSLYAASRGAGHVLRRSGAFDLTEDL